MNLLLINKIVIKIIKLQNFNCKYYKGITIYNLSQEMKRGDKNTNEKMNVKKADSCFGPSKAPSSVQ